MYVDIFFYFLFTWDVRVNLCVSQLISTSPEINDQ
jgi:hypothetical protein